MARAARHKLVIPSRLTDVPRVVAAVLAEVDAHRYNEDCRFAIHLAVEEAVSNAMRHGNGLDPARQVTVEYCVTSRQARITVCDEGCGFCPGGLPDPTLPENIDRPSGRGVLLMRTYMTSVRFNKRGNCVTMTKVRNSGPPAPDPGRPN